MKHGFKLKKKQAESHESAAHITVDGIPIELKFKKVIRGRLSVNDKGCVSFTVPHGVDARMLEGFVRKKIDWLHRHLKSVQMSMPLERTFINGEFVTLFGKRHECLVFEADFNRIELEDTVVKMYFRKDLSCEKKLKVLREFYKDLLGEAIEKRLPFWEQKTGLRAGGWRIKAVRSCWGSCNPLTGALLFNLALVKKSKECIDYIIVHELSHMVSRLHNDIFKNFVSKHFPTWKQVRRELNEKTVDYAD